MPMPSELHFCDLAPKLSSTLTRACVVPCSFELFTYIIIIANVGLVVLLALSELIRYWLCCACFLPLFDWSVKWWPGAGVSFVYTLTAVAWL